MHLNSMNPTLSRRRALTLLVVTAAASACGDTASESKRAELAPLEFDASTPNLLFTWIDEVGGTHPETALSAIPEAHRDLVRVVVSDDPRGNTDPIYVADARSPDGAGKYTARSFDRATWEDEISRRRRDASPEALAAADGRERKRPRERRPTHDGTSEREAPRAGADATSAPSSKPAEKPAFGSLVAIVYGAAWCGPCKHAKAHLAKRKVQVDYRDIESDASARKEMATKLGPRGQRGSIPVIDIGGRILVGYSAQALDRAIDDAMSKNTVL